MLAMPQFALPGGSILLAADIASGADRAYPDTVTIRFTEPAPADSAAAAESIQMYQFRGAVLTKPDYDRALEEYNRAIYNNRPENAKRPEQRRQ